MRPLSNVMPTPEQVAIFSRNRPGVEVIRGAAGSGKTTTALLKLRSAITMFVARKRRLGILAPVQVLVLTFNRTLRGYIEVLAREQVAEYGPNDILLEVSTFAKWAKSKLGNPNIVDDALREKKISELAAIAHLGLDPKFAIEEIEYLLGRFVPRDFGNYLTARRDGRGISPRVERPVRELILDQVIGPYGEWKSARRELDWNDLAVHLGERPNQSYDIIIADESQDFSANQIRAILSQLKTDHSMTFVLDTVQRLYPRGFSWVEVGVTVRPEGMHRLRRNYRNTIQIARFAEPIVRGLAVDDDATLPDFSRCEREGPLPIVLRGGFELQLRYAIDNIKAQVDLSRETVAFLHPLGWFSLHRTRLGQASLPFVEITKKSEWPEGTENIALCTLHSAKGLEFDHVIILGLNAEVLRHGVGDDDDRLTMLRRLLAMGIGRARKSVILGYKPDEASVLVGYFEPGTFNEVNL